MMTDPKEKRHDWPLGLRDVAVVFGTTEERQQFQLIGLLVEHEFETADVAAIHGVRARPVFGGVMRDRRPASGTMPWHGEEKLIAEVNRLCQEPDRAHGRENQRSLDDIHDTLHPRKALMLSIAGKESAIRDR